MQTPVTKTISRRQLAVLVFIVSIGAKMFSLPILMLKMGGRSAWLALGILLLIDIAILIALSVTSRLNKGETAFAILEKSTGRLVTKLIFAGLIFALFLRALMLVFNISDFFLGNLFDGLPKWAFLIPLCLLLIPLGSKSLRTLGRTSEILIFFILPALAVIFFLIAKMANGVSLLPLFGDNGGEFGRTMVSFAFFFTDVAALFIALGKVGVVTAEENASKQGQDEGQKITLPKKSFGYAIPIAATVAGALVCAYGILMFASFIDVRTYLNPTVLTSVTHAAITRFALGRFDKLMFVVLISGVLITLGVVFYALTSSMHYIVGKGEKGRFSHNKIKTVIAFGFTLALYFCGVFINPNRFYDFILSYGIYFAGIIVGGFVVLLLVCAFIRGRVMVVTDGDNASATVPASPTDDGDDAVVADVAARHIEGGNS